ncbi:hypothetical protein CDCA_CDCA10G3053 [Cyanidium caldarium]|uniref:DUF913 domain-containing protein n=1 Tax=Cyanidium caldarium TaxID=2771 RepID=A0AAV9IXI5_CYACA|nr:hypothetical protein CDCA_CDCA10G3053 [Cyanidium caldarium]
MEDTGRPDEWDVAGGQAWLAALVQDHRRWRPCDGDERRLQAALLQLRQALRERYGGGGTTLWWLSDGGVRAPDDAAAVIDFEQLPVSQYGYWEAFLARVHQALERQCAAMRTTTTTTSGTGGADTVDKRTTPPYSGETMCLLLEVSARVLTNLFPESRHRYPSTNLLAELLVAAAPVDLAVVRSALEVLWSLVSAPLFHKPSCGPADPTWGGAYLRPLLSALVAHHPLYDELLRHERPEHVAHPIEAGRTAGGSASLALDASSAASADDGDRAAPRVPLLLYPETGTASDSFDSGCRSSPLSEASASTAAAPPPPPRECAACGTEPTGASLLEAISRTPDARETPRSPQATAVDPDDPPETVADQMARFRQAWQERLRRMRIHNACPHLQAARCLALSIRYQALAVLLALGTAPNQRDAPPADDPHLVAHLLEVVRGDRRLSGRLDARVEPLLRRSGLRLMAAGVSALRLERPILSSLGGDLGCGWLLTAVRVALDDEAVRPGGGPSALDVEHLDLCLVTLYGSLRRERRSSSMEPRLQLMLAHTLDRMVALAGTDGVPSAVSLLLLTFFTTALQSAAVAEWPTGVVDQPAERLAPTVRQQAMARSMHAVARAPGAATTTTTTTTTTRMESVPAADAEAMQAMRTTMGTLAVSDALWMKEALRFLISVHETVGAAHQREATLRGTAPDRSVLPNGSSHPETPAFVLNDGGVRGVLRTLLSHPQRFGAAVWSLAVHTMATLMNDDPANANVFWEERVADALMQVLLSPSAPEEPHAGRLPPDADALACSLHALEAMCLRRDRLERLLHSDTASSTSLLQQLLTAVVREPLHNRQLARSVHQRGFGFANLHGIMKQDTRCRALVEQVVADEIEALTQQLPPSSVSSADVDVGYRIAAAMLLMNALLRLRTSRGVTRSVDELGVDAEHSARLLTAFRALWPLALHCARQLLGVSLCCAAADRADPAYMAITDLADQLRQQLLHAAQVMEVVELRRRFPQVLGEALQQMVAVVGMDTATTATTEWPLADMCVDRKQRFFSTTPMPRQHPSRQSSCALAGALGAVLLLMSVFGKRALWERHVRGSGSAPGERLVSDAALIHAVGCVERLCRVALARAGFEAVTVYPILLGEGGELEIEIVTAAPGSARELVGMPRAMAIFAVHTRACYKSLLCDFGLETPVADVFAGHFFALETLFATTATAAASAACREQQRGVYFVGLMSTLRALLFDSGVPRRIGRGLLCAMYARGWCAAVVRWVRSLPLNAATSPTWDADIIRALDALLDVMAVAPAAELPLLERGHQVNGAAAGVKPNAELVAVSSLLTYATVPVRLLLTSPCRHRWPRFFALRLCAVTRLLLMACSDQHVAALGLHRRLDDNLGLIRDDASLLEAEASFSATAGTLVRAGGMDQVLRMDRVRSRALQIGARRQRYATLHPSPFRERLAEALYEALRAHLAAEADGGPVWDATVLAELATLIDESLWLGRLHRELETLLLRWPRAAALWLERLGGHASVKLHRAAMEVLRHAHWSALSTSHSANTARNLTPDHVWLYAVLVRALVADSANGPDADRLLIGDHSGYLTTVPYVPRGVLTALLPKVLGRTALRRMWQYKCRLVPLPSSESLNRATVELLGSALTADADALLAALEAAVALTVAEAPSARHALGDTEIWAAVHSITNAAKAPADGAGMARRLRAWMLGAEYVRVRLYQHDVSLVVLAFETAIREAFRELTTTAAAAAALPEPCVTRAALAPLLDRLHAYHPLAMKVACLRCLREYEGGDAARKPAGGRDRSSREPRYALNVAAVPRIEQVRVPREVLQTALGQCSAAGTYAVAAAVLAYGQPLAQAVAEWLNDDSDRHSVGGEAAVEYRRWVMAALWGEDGGGGGGGEISPPVPWNFLAVRSLLAQLSAYAGAPRQWVIGVLQQVLERPAAGAASSADRHPSASASPDAHPPLVVEERLAQVVTRALVHDDTRQLTTSAIGDLLLQWYESRLGTPPATVPLLETLYQMACWNGPAVHEHGADADGRYPLLKSGSVLEGHRLRELMRALPALKGDLFEFADEPSRAVGAREAQHGRTGAADRSMPTVVWEPPLEETAAAMPMEDA